LTSQYRCQAGKSSSPFETPPHMLKKEAALPEWQAAIEALMLVVEHGGPTMFARIGITRALNRNYVPEFTASGKTHHWGTRKLKRDQP
jgi:hypothetical protein